MSLVLQIESIQSQVSVQSIMLELTVCEGSAFPDPVSDVTNEVKEEISLRYADHFVRQLDEQAEALSGLHVEPLGDGCAEVRGSSGGFHQESLRWK